MTLIECFTESHMDNLAACLRLRPEKLILIGNAGDMRGPAERYDALLRDRGIRTRLSLCDVGNQDFGQTCATLHRCLCGEPDCVIDLTGGDELVIMAVGTVVAALKDSHPNLQVQKYDHHAHRAVDCLNHNRALPGRAVTLPVKDLIRLHGGGVQSFAEVPLSENAYAEISRLWDVMTQDSGAWNRSISLLNELESRADSRTQVYLPIQQLRERVSGFAKKEDDARAFLERLHAGNIIRNESSRNALSYTYHSPLLRYCTLKAGNLLEVKALLEAQSLTENGKPFFQDCRVGVTIDWDNRFHHPAEGVPDTRNEIDLILMRGITPLFISCKNGSIGEEELYKLHTVATRFGGPQARKMLIATNLERRSAASELALSQRAWDMDIFLVPDAAELTHSQWHDLFTQAVQ